MPVIFAIEITITILAHTSKHALYTVVSRNTNISQPHQRETIDQKFKKSKQGLILTRPHARDKKTNNFRSMMFGTQCKQKQTAKITSAQTKTHVVRTLTTSSLLSCLGGSTCSCTIWPARSSSSCFM